MHYAVIAAGEGSRLVSEGIITPKPLVEINGESLIARLIRIFTDNNAESITIILNSHTPRLAERVAMPKSSTEINIINKTTPSSMHSLYELEPYLRKGKFCLTTVDTIFREDEFSSFIKYFEKDQESDAVMGVTDFIDDEKPLYVAVGGNMKITGFYDTPQEEIRYISAGVYALSGVCLDTLKRSITSGVSRMRNYQRALSEEGLSLRAYPFSKVIDIDHASDIDVAEKFVQQSR